jgi:hypothetical protein
MADPGANLLAGFRIGYDAIDNTRLVLEDRAKQKRASNIAMMLNEQLVSLQTETEIANQKVLDIQDRMQRGEVVTREEKDAAHIGAIQAGMRQVQQSTILVSQAMAADPGNEHLERIIAPIGKNIGEASRALQEFTAFAVSRSDRAEDVAMDEKRFAAEEENRRRDDARDEERLELDRTATAAQVRAADALAEKRRAEAKDKEDPYEKNVKSAKVMIDNHVPDDMIVRSTGLPLEEVQRLRTSVKEGEAADEEAEEGKKSLAEKLAPLAEGDEAKQKLVQEIAEFEGLEQVARDSGRTGDADYFRSRIDAKVAIVMDAATGRTKAAQDKARRERMPRETHRLGFPSQ